MSFHELMVIGSNLGNRSNARPMRVLTKTHVIIESFLAKYLICDEIIKVLTW